MTGLTAIDILINPDQASLDQARAINARLRESVPDGFALDATHTPHITTLQRFVRTTDLDQVFDAVRKTIAGTDFAALTFHCAAIAHQDQWGPPGTALAGLVLTPSPAVLDFQARLLDAVAAYTEPNGTAAAFVTDAADPDITPATIAWVQGYLDNQLGANYVPHITVGFATIVDLTRIEAEPLDPFDVHPASVSVYHLGNNGTARTELKAWTTTR